MAQTGRTRTTSTYGYNTRSSSRNAYVYGNTARQLDVRRELQNVPQERGEYRPRRKERPHSMTLGYVLFLTIALCASGLFLVSYIQLQAEFTSKSKTVSQMEMKLNNMRLANDENYNRIVSSVDLEEVKRVAIGELGMTYAREGQIISYKSVGNDYMRKVASE